MHNVFTVMNKLVPAVLAAAAVALALLWYAAYTEAGALKAQLEDWKSRYEALQSQHAQLQSQLGGLQDRLSNLSAEYADLEKKYADLQRQYSQLQREAEGLRRRIYGAGELASRLKALLREVRVEAPAVGDVWRFTTTRTVANALVGPRSFHIYALTLSAGQTLRVSVTANLTVAVMNLTQAARYYNATAREFLAQGRGSLSFTPDRSGVYFIAVENGGSAPAVYNMTYSYDAPIHYCSLSSHCGRPEARGLFRLVALYDYWLSRRQELAGAVLAEYPNLTLAEAYALSLAALLKSAGLNATFAVAGAGPADPLRPVAALPTAVFYAAEDPLPVLADYLNNAPPAPRRFLPYLQKTPGGYALYVAVDTYYIYLRDAGGPGGNYTVTYIDGLTRLP